MLRFPIVIIVCGVLTVISPVIRVVSCVQSSCGAPTTHPASGTAVSEGNYTFRLGEANGMRVGAVVVSMIASLAIETILASGTLPNSVLGLKLSTKMTAVGEGEWMGGAASRCFFVVILWHSVPPEAMITSVFDGRG